LSSLVIGTAGHVDHGKTMLIRALTGKDTDRLQEEKDRGVSIDLGFASFPLPDGRVAGIIDVPGHERFIHNMLAGAGGIDLMLLVIDVNEGIMPQTREHLGIMELLGTQQGIIALTKTDLAGEEWCQLVEEEVRQELQDTFLNNAPLVRVSSATGQGIEELKKLLQKMTEGLTAKDSLAPLRIPVDRCFTVSGFGTVITGTLLQGAVSRGDTVEVLPSKEKARVRNVQIFGSNVSKAGAGHRVALNLSGMERDKVERGSAVCTPGFFKTTTMLDASLKLLIGSPWKLKHMDPVHLYQGTARVVARIALLDREELKPGEEALVQVRMDTPLVAERQDRYIIRSYSPMTTIGGGIILDPLPTRRHRRFRKEVLQQLKELQQEVSSGGDDTYILQQLEKMQLADLSSLEKETRFNRDKVSGVLARLREKGRVVEVGEAVVTSQKYQGWKQKLTDYLKDYHDDHPLSPGISRAELKKLFPSRMSIKNLDAFLERWSEEQQIELIEDKVCLYGFRPSPGPRVQKNIARLEERFNKAGFQPPRPIQLSTEIGLEASELEELLDYLVYQGKLVKINEDIYFLREHYREALKYLYEHFEENSRLTLAEFRDRLATSRKYVQPLLEHFDREKITKRIEDYRVLSNYKREK